MKTKILLLGVLLAMNWDAPAQGRIWFYTPSARTRLWATNGPLAGPEIWGQLLAGPTSQTLAPVGTPEQHFSGAILGPIIEVPTVPCSAFGYAQMMVWDGRLWGTAFENVPPSQLGATDVVSLPFSCFTDPVAAPWFMQPAIVPIPEPSVVTLGILTAGLLFGNRFARRQLRHPK